MDSGLGVVTGVRTPLPYEKMKLTIDRRWWQRGSKVGSLLLSPIDGKMCCLGFAALELGFDPLDIVTRGTPNSIHPATKTNEQVEFCERSWGEAIHANDWNLASGIDGRFTSEAGREQAIIEELAKGGFEVEFVN